MGDSSIVAGTNHENERGEKSFSLTPLCSAPQTGTGTYVIADPNWLHYVASNEVRAPHITTVIVATDGANTFFLDNTVFKPDWPAALEGRLRELGPLTFVNTFAYFIQHQPPENHDDRTLLVAYRPPPELAPPAPKSR